MLESAMAASQKKSTRSGANPTSSPGGLKARSGPYSRQRAYHQRKPWAKYVSWARRRCADRASKWFQFYGAKGITCPMTASEAEILWKRDAAHTLTRPSLDRRDPTIGYTFENCRFIEFNDNSMLAWNKDFKWLYEQAEA